MLVKLELIEGECLLQDIVAGRRKEVLLEVGNGLSERETMGKFDQADEVAAATTAVAEKQIFAGIDIERGLGFRVQGAQAQELRPGSHAASGPVALAQVIEQRKTLFECVGVERMKRGSGWVEQHA